jgi:hypothetical protein
MLWPQYFANGFLLKKNDRHICFACFLFFHELCIFAIDYSFLKQVIMKTIHLLFPLIFALFLLPCPPFCQCLDQWNETAMKNLEKAAHSFISTIPDDVVSNYGIENNHNIEASKLGWPVMVFTIADDSLVSTGIWRVPLLIGNEYKALFTFVEDSSDGFRIVDFGAATLAQELYKASEIVEVKGLLRVYELRRDFFITANANGETEFLSIPKAVPGTYSFDDILNIIR